MFTCLESKTQCILIVHKWLLIINVSAIHGNIPTSPRLTFICVCPAWYDRRDIMFLSILPSVCLSVRPLRTALSKRWVIQTNYHVCIALPPWCRCYDGSLFLMFSTLQTVLCRINNYTAPTRLAFICLHTSSDFSCNFDIIWFGIYIFNGVCYRQPGTWSVASSLTVTASGHSQSPLH